MTGVESRGTSAPIPLPSLPSAICRHDRGFAKRRLLVGRPRDHRVAADRGYCRFGSDRDTARRIGRGSGASPGCSSRCGPRFADRRGRRRCRRGRSSAHRNRRARFDNLNRRLVARPGCRHPCEVDGRNARPGAGSCRRGASWRGRGRCSQRAGRRWRLVVAPLRHLRLARGGNRQRTEGRVRILPRGILATGQTDRGGENQQPPRTVRWSTAKLKLPHGPILAEPNMVRRDALNVPAKRSEYRREEYRSLLTLPRASRRLLA
jgi:hypothetical protein